MQTVSLPPALAIVAHGRDHITTAGFARAMCRATQTVLKNHCLTGECYGVRPIKRGKMLMWPLDGVARALSAEA
ncbi:hypothetical protein ASF04_07990 [Duganella sp. Leaf61]|nr:hypothetical protein ASF04_07990 [Duganella sp. Leaf61]